ncbi:hypothetical protein [Peribacillus asahii]|uniref:hypothetical protein n=1 Tax=Peribacillus asahii TaxID=228899 RepID=UPI0020796493|nr:hypothetical protein [Peribacillus asahii]USK72677.1 hypothetical protein LIS76_23430 [Peribacillus asahii]USK72714.1 hypothetical protein LIS76_24010 [Peribacillus asahii]
MRMKSKLIHRCTLVHKGQKVGADSYGRDIFGDVPEPNVYCRLDSVTDSRSQGDTGTDFLTSHMMFFAPDQELSMDMVVKDIEDKYGNVVLSGEFIADKIKPVYGRRKLHHFEVSLKKG